jgi:transposase
MAAKRRAFTPEFKQNAVKLVLSGKKSCAHIARDLGIRADLLFRWQRELAPQSTIEAEAMNLSAAERRVRELERELAIVKEEREILKKATALFAKG